MWAQCAHRPTSIKFRPVISSMYHQHSESIQFLAKANNEFEQLSKHFFFIVSNPRMHSWYVIGLFKE